VTFLVPLLLTSPVLAGPWVRDPGAHYVKVGGSHFTAGVYDDPNVSDDTALAYTGQLVSVYGELGLPKGLQLVFQSAYSWGTNRDLETGWIYRSRGLGDLGLGLVADIPWVEVPLSVAISTRIPLYDDGVAPGLHPSLGDPQVDVDAAVAAGQAVPLGPHWLWFVEELGFRYRTHLIPAQHLQADRKNGLIYRAQAGLSPSAGDRDLGWVHVGASGVWNPVSDETTQGWHQWSAGAAGTLWRGLNLEVGFQHIYLATNASTGWGVNAGISWKGVLKE
jgi:hypothetical protein